MDEKEYLSKEKYQELEAELEELKTDKRKEVAKKLEESKALGDLSENAEYHAARDEQADIEDRIKQIENLIRDAEIIGKQKHSVVEIGSEVTVKNSQGQEDTYTIVGSEEADMVNKKISNHSPIGEALAGHKKGDEIMVKTPKGDSKFLILDIK